MSDSVLRLAARQGGVVRREQLLKLGIPSSTIAHRVERGVYSTVVAGVYRVLDLREWDDRLTAVVSGLPGAVASHDSAAALHRFPDWARRDLVVLVPSHTTHEWPGATVRRASDLARSDRTRVGRHPATTPERTLFDLAGILPEGRFLDLTDSLLSTGVVNQARFTSLAERLCRRGKPGSGVVGRLVRDRLGPSAMSTLERRGHAILSPVFSAELRREYRVPWGGRERFDLALPQYRVAIEWDSTLFHRSPDRFESDRRKDRLAALHGWVVLRFTWDDVTQRPDRVLGEVLAVVERRGRLVI